jgi:hypothetical protein
MEELKEKFGAKFRVDPTIDERYGDKPLFPHKIERIKTLLKGTKFDKSTTADKVQTPA